MPVAESSEQARIQSVETGIRLLWCLAELCLQGPPPMLKTLAAEAKMPPAKAHRYLVSFVRTWAVERDPTSGRYRLGPMARHIGLSAIRSLDVVRIASARLPQICADINQTVALSIWGLHGPTIVSLEEVRRTITISTRVGEVMPVLSSATGRVYGAWLSPAQTKALIDKELKQTRPEAPDDMPTNRKQVDDLFQRTKAEGYGYVLAGLNPLINAAAAPIFDSAGHLVAALSTLGPKETLDPRPGGTLEKKLRRAADQISTELGYLKVRREAEPVSGKA